MKNLVQSPARRLWLLAALLSFMLAQLPLNAQQKQAIRQQAAIRYLKKTARRNQRFVRRQEKNMRRFLHRTAKKEQGLLAAGRPDSTATDSSIRINTYADMEQRLKQDLKEQVQVQPGPQGIQLSAVPPALDANVKDYLKQQLITTAYLADSCKRCAKLKKQAGRAQQSIERSAQQLEKLQQVQNQIKQRQQLLQSYCGKMPELSGKLKQLEKSSYYFRQRMNGFKQLYTLPAAGIEKRLLSKLAFSRGFSVFSTNMKAMQLPGLLPTAPDLSGFQTKAMVQAQLPQNARGISEQARQQLQSNFNNSLQEFNELKQKSPDLSALKDKPSFRPNPYKGLPLRMRIKPAYNFQVNPKAEKFPVTVDAGLTLGYKLMPRLTPLIGVAYRAGLGHNIQHIQLTHEGLTARGGFDCKLFYGFSVQCTYEETWKLNRLQGLNPGTLHEPSLIVGLVNKSKISKKQKSTFMIGYDFFAHKHTPYTTPLVIRMGFE